MGHPPSMDLRIRLLAAVVDNGMSCRAAAARLALRHRRQSTSKHSDGKPATLLLSHKAATCGRIEERGVDMLAFWAARKDISLEELRLALIEIGLHVSVAGQPLLRPPGHGAQKRLFMPSNRTDPTS